jgi:hypothetical protein
LNLTGSKNGTFFSRVNPDRIKAESVLRAAFLKSELEFLQEQPSFSTALVEVKTHDDFEKLCALGEQILATHQRAHPAAREFRHEQKNAAPSAPRQRL